ncbi:YhhN-like protein [Microbacterium sp. cf046]|uniref:lysoplasmalogenase n=1 Tax=Microbacterium sp. cf046 TaxID=1761803 RepID=UPI0008F009DB|nr:lysoplasmalogenase [Microbacterium sp. cf046]SFS02332.1 YhhN-like protein [Microbacterium sp. cf046]
MRRLLIGFTPYAVVSLVHVVALAVGAEAVAGPTKLLLMPLLAFAVFWGGRSSRWGTTYTLLFLAIALSWLGDAAGTLFPTVPTVPMMLIFFGLAHLFYIWIFWRRIPIQRVPKWAIVYGLWWGLLLWLLGPSLGSLFIPVAVYGLVLAGTAVAASRCHPLVAAGGAFFFASDALLAFQLFRPETVSDWSSPLIMFTYCLGQGLIAAGVIVADRLQAAAIEAERAGDAA